MSRLGTALRILQLLSTSKGAFPGVTRGEIRAALKLPADTEITARCRELRDYPGYGGFTVKVERSAGTTEWRYWIPYRERIRAQRFIAAWRKRERTVAA